METTIRYRRSKLFTVIMIMFAALALGVAAYTVTHSALSHANLGLSGSGGDPPPAYNSTVISYVTVNHTVTSTLVATTTVYSISANNSGAITTQTVTKTVIVTVKTTRSSTHSPSQ